MSAQGVVILALSCVAASAVTQYRCIGYDNAQASVAGQNVKGVSQRPAALGESFEVATLGTTPAEAGGAFVAGDYLTTDNQGRVVVASALQVAAGATAVTSSAANGAIVSGSYPATKLVGVALQASAGAGSVVEILLSL